MCLPVRPYAILREWEHEGLKCAVTQAHEHGHLCGYVRVPPEHPFYGKDYDDIGLSTEHFSVNFSEPEPCAHEDGQGWWLGFDCAQSLFTLDPEADISWLDPEARRLLFKEIPGIPRHYWRQPEVEAEVQKLSEELSRMTK